MMTETKRASVLILGIGNLLLSDEGIGIHAIRCLAQNELPPDVEILDGGTSGADLVDDLEGRTKVVVLDAASGDGPPGTVYRCEAHELMEQEGGMSLHEFGLSDSLHMAEQLGCAPKRVIVLGVQPANLRPGMELSPEVAAILPGILKLALAEAAAK
jgi:hydrogenase maturation protease